MTKRRMRAIQLLIVTTGIYSIFVLYYLLALPLLEVAPWTSILVLWSSALLVGVCFGFAGLYLYVSAWVHLVASDRLVEEGWTCERHTLFGPRVKAMPHSYAEYRTTAYFMWAVAAVAFLLALVPSTIIGAWESSLNPQSPLQRQPYVVLWAILSGGGIVCSVNTRRHLYRGLVEFAVHLGLKREKGMKRSI